jgi:ATP-dependent RNA helicase SUPV3L1/SUV3
MEALAAAKSGIYLAPLRLLALENYERLIARGIRANLMTGEERVFDPKARHTCATVEMCDFSTPVEVAVVDECQLLADPQRGWAWTAALLGAPAKALYACGAPNVRDALVQLAGICGEPLAEQSFERLVPLEVGSSAVSLGQVREGDAVIAFSRRDVLQFAAALKARGLGVAVLYGALSPEVRRSQVQSFADGRAQCVVATDCIGLGVNMPLKRVIFSSARKYDGVSNRYLIGSEIRQIAGRAGRYGMAEKGVATAFSQSDIAMVAAGLAGSDPQIEGPFKVMPTWSHVETILRELGTGDVEKAFEFFERVKFGGSFAQADLSDCLARCRQIKTAPVGVSPENLFKLSCAPADPRNERDMHMLWNAAHAVGSDYYLPIPQARFDLEAKEPGGAALQEAEAYSRSLALYSWIACKWPDAVKDDGLADLRGMCAEFIDRALLAHRGDFVSRSRRRYGWRDEDFDDGWGSSDED